MSISSGQKLMVAALFKQERQEGDEQFQIFGKPWIGSVVSSPVELTFSKGCIMSLDSSADTGVMFRR
jgi:hypothetical protein